MPYFFIVPTYIALLVGLICAASLARSVPRFRPISAHILGGAVGTLAGFIAVNIIVMVTGFAPAWLAQKFTFPVWLHHASKYFVAAVLLIGPFFGSAIGVLLGFVAGVYFVSKRNKQALRQSA